MKLSQAIRRGARRSYQVFNDYGDGHGGTCAMGAALLGSGHLAIKDIYGKSRSFPEMFHFQVLFAKTLFKLVVCPVCTGAGEAGNIVVHLNDNHKWSRERIAGWLESSVELPTYTLQQIQNYMQAPELPAAAIKKDEAKS